MLSEYILQMSRCTEKMLILAGQVQGFYSRFVSQLFTQNVDHKVGVGWLVVGQKNCALHVQHCLRRLQKQLPTENQLDESKINF